jgi:hypothetical protein
MTVIFEQGLLRPAIRRSVQWGAIDNHLVVRILGVVGRVVGRVVDCVRG